MAAPMYPRPTIGLLSRREAAQYLGVAEHTLAVWHSTQRHSLPIIKVGRLVKYRRSDLDAFITSNQVGGPAVHSDE